MKKVELFEKLWTLEFKYKQLRLKLECRGISPVEESVLIEIETIIESVQFNLLPDKPKNYIFKTSLKEIRNEKVI